MEAECTCKKTGCYKSFKHRTQLHRHMRECEYQSPPPEQNKYKKVSDDDYQCNTCNKHYPYRASILRHSEKSDCHPKEKVLYTCDVCSRQFEYPSKLA